MLLHLSVILWQTRLRGPRVGILRGLTLLPALPVHFYVLWRFLYYSGFIRPISSKIFVSVTKSRPYQDIKFYQIYFAAQRKHIGLRCQATLHYLSFNLFQWERMLDCIIWLGDILLRQLSVYPTDPTCEVFCLRVLQLPFLNKPTFDF